MSKQVKKLSFYNYLSSTQNAKRNNPLTGTWFHSVSIIFQPEPVETLPGAMPGEAGPEGGTVNHRRFCAGLRGGAGLVEAAVGAARFLGSLTAAWVMSASERRAPPISAPHLLFKLPARPRHAFPPPD